MNTLDLRDAKTTYVDGKLVIESEELAQAIQDRTLDFGAEEEGNGIFNISVNTTVIVQG